MRDEIVSPTESFDVPEERENLPTVIGPLGNSKILNLKRCSVFTCRYVPLKIIYFLLNITLAVTLKKLDNGWSQMAQQGR